MVSFDDPFSTHGPIETTPVVPREGGRRWYRHDKILENTTTRHKVIHNFYKPSENTIVLQSEFKYTMTYIIYKDYIIFKFYNSETSSKKRTCN